MIPHSAISLPHANQYQEDDHFEGLAMLAQDIYRQQQAAQSTSPNHSRRESSPAPQEGLSSPERLPDVEVVEPASVASSAASAAIVDRPSIDSMRSPPSYGLGTVFNQAVQTISRLSTSVMLSSAHVAAPLLVNSLRGSIEAVAAHYPEQVQELTALAAQGQQRLQVLTDHVGGMGDRYALRAESIDQQWGAVNHSVQGLQEQAQQAKVHMSHIRQEACRSVLHTGAMIGSVYALSCVASYWGLGGASLQKNIPSLGWMAAGMAGKMIYDCYHSEPFRQLSETCTGMFTELVQMGQAGLQLSNELVASASTVLRDTSVLMNEARNAGLIPREALLERI